ncbi:MAG: aldo/keto reductase [Butyrivibrio sp.]|nr:aldo/keto reductase [Butyrivibrio sp.]
MSDYFGKEIKKLGFGLMRLPRIEGSKDDIDVEQTARMVDAFLAAGGTYFDTAYVYGGSEEATRKALVERHPRDSYTLATKLNARAAGSEEAAKKQFETSLERTGAEYFDFYLLHALGHENVPMYNDFHLWDFVHEQHAKGRIKHMGFSFHADPELLDQLLTEHPEVEFVQLQINYADWENPQVQSRANYEVARRHGKSIVVMEPVKGGTLANPPQEVQDLFKAYNPQASCASWAIRFVASLDGILTVLSGMSNMAQMEDNLSYMKDFKPLNEEEQRIIRQAQAIMGQSKTIACTACHYCTEGCPMQIPIPDVFSAMNLRLGNGQLEAASAAYRQLPEGHRADACVGCGQCESVCPQHLPIIRHLKECAAAL